MNPAPIRVLVGVVQVSVGWGLIFGWIDGDIWTWGNWLEAVAAGFVLLIAISILIPLTGHRRMP